MKNILLLSITALVLLASCRSTRKIQTAIARKDSLENISINAKEDSVRFIRQVYRTLEDNRINYNTFSAKIKVDYIDGDGKKYDLNAFVRMRKDSVIWVTINAIFGIEALRAHITRDSVKLLDKHNKVYTARSVAYLQEVSALPLDLTTLQDLIIGNPIFLDSNIVSYTMQEDQISLTSLGDFFKNLVTLSASDTVIRRSKLDDANILLSRTCDLSYSDYENKKGVNFATKRRITVVEKKKLDIEMEFKQYEFNEPLTFPFAIPKNYKRN